MIIVPGNKIEVYEYFREGAGRDAKWLKRPLEHGSFQSFGAEGDENGVGPSVIYINESGQFKSAPVDLVILCAS